MANVSAASSAPKGTSIWSATAKPSSKAGTGDMGKDDFLRLMLAQLKQQDPLKPMDDQAFIAQTAQFNALQEMQNVNKTLTALFGSQQLSEASGLIGKTIEATDSEGKAVTGAVTGVSVEKGVAKLHVGKKTINLDKVTKVAADAGTLPASDAAAGSGAAAGA